MTEVWAAQENLAKNPVNEEESWEDDWEDEDWEDIEWDDNPEPAKPPAAKAPVKPAQITTAVGKDSEPKASAVAPQETSEEPVFDFESEKAKKEQIDKLAQQLAQRYSRTPEDLKNLYAIYGEQLSGLNPNNPKDLREIEKLIEIVGIPKAIGEKPVEQTLKQAPKDDPIVNFSARSIPVRDAFATLARVSGKSITVSGNISDRDQISVVEINDQPFTKAFMSLVEAAGVDFSVNADNYTVLKRQGGATTLFSRIDTSDLDLSLPLDARFADLTYDNQDIASIIKDLANRYGVDIVMTATPTERVTLKVKGINIAQALELIFSGSQFKFTRKGDTFVVYSSTNKNFALDYKTVLFPLKYLDANEASKLLPTELKSAVKVSENQNALIAEGSKDILMQTFEFLRTIDKPLPQVELDVKLVEVSKAIDHTLNVLASPFQWGRENKLIESTKLSSGSSTSSATTAANAAKSVAFKFGKSVVPTWLSFNRDVYSIFSNTPSYNQGNSFSQIKVSQRLFVTSGKSARINFDQDINVLLNAVDSTGQTSTLAAQTQKIQRVTAGNSMNITPVVGGGDVVTVKVEVEVSVNGAINKNGIPESTKRRRISSEIQIINHETIALGGLFDDQNSNSIANEIPLLSRIPIIGSLFSNSNKRKNQTELLILITPHIKKNVEGDAEQIYIQAGR